MKRPTITQAELSRLARVARKEGVAIDLIEEGRTIRIYPGPSHTDEESDGPRKYGVNAARSNRGRTALGPEKAFEDLLKLVDAQDREKREAARRRREAAEKQKIPPVKIKRRSAKTVSD